MPAESGPPVFSDVAAHAGLHYQWTIAGKRPLNILQTIGNGCAFLDYNNDGNLDILLVGPKVGLYQGDGHGHFTDVSHQSGLDKLYGNFLGCAVGDYDNDGYEDIYLTAYRGGVLLHNEAREEGKREKGKGKREDQAPNAQCLTPDARIFRDVTKKAGIKPQPWGTSASFVDVDRDSKLDLYIGNYVVFGPNIQPQLCIYGGIPTSCGPQKYAPERGVLYHNLGGGRFQDVTKAWGFDRVSGKALGVAAAPPDNAGQVDLAIANDQVPGDLISSRGGNSRNEGISSGMAYKPDGTVYAGMGIDWGDYDNDGKLDLVVGTYQNQAKFVFRNQGGAFVAQNTAHLGMLSSAPYITFGIKWLDVDNDGWLDLMLANGHVEDNIADIPTVSISPAGNVYRQPVLLYHNEQGQTFTDQTVRLDKAAQRPIVGRGLAIGDFDNDGRMDALVADSEGKPLLLHNVTPHTGHWLLVKLVGTKCNRDGYGAVITVETGGRKLLRFCHADGSYLSSSDKRVHFGLGTATKIERLQVRWPDGHVDTYRHLPADRILRIKEGEPRLDTGP